MINNLDLLKDSNENINEYIKNIVENYSVDKNAKVITHGCQMNEHDSEKIEWLLEKMGYNLVEENEDSDLIILNTCSIRHSAEDKVYGQLGSLKHLKKSKPGLKIGVCGCMMQRDESREYVLEKFENVDIIFGTNNIWKLPELLSKNYASNKTTVDIEENSDNLDDYLGANRLYSYKSYVNIMYGCNNFCTYCIVPFTRGRERSREPEDILKEIKFLAENGTKEITLLGQNVNSYGKSLESPISFAELIYRVSEISGIERIRFMTSHPKDISDDLIYAYRDIDKLCNFLHLPVQAGSSRVLKLMNRKYTKEDYLRKIDKIKNVNPDIALCTDLMIGFPSETEEDFLETIDLVKRVQYDTSFTFIYSMREGTLAAKSNEQVPDDIKHNRFERLLDVLYSIQLTKNLNFIGKTCKVLVEDVSKNNKEYLTGRTDEFKLVNFKGNVDNIGKIIDVKIVDANTFSLKGEIIG
ncbi:tRNA (N6-isopentenyl adenosine(37)-C2)-methylthiotransferase MiaB [Anaerosphaera multitolerans]|uniref:tRNA-2-methylthio-N(6)-dimethylallyladenosine synthase n=1 Tax=Anaerosphaera multitolerans TaxID=2487351 RepID=A0A437S5G1_9FIRM|nr:tRNA (N6-isopentenyl adenosine(37)-C2)-methylthiotransferase MiaB [Anaerosphaera multitolerans]RVU54146.1 tRNA (N6-isopentenyl adenosine(37)-C2)-methylthiotransferase MiaB [Anaerosphaera multitolerans]